jgi:hypothetical protein
MPAQNKTEIMAEDIAYEMVLRRRRRKLAYARYLIGYGSITSLLVVLVAVGVSWAEGRPIDLNRFADIAVAGLIALGAGSCLAGRKIMRRWLKIDALPPEPTHPRAKPLTTQLRLLSWAGVIMMSAGFALLLLFALSIGCDRPEWTVWLPSRRR